MASCTNRNLRLKLRDGCDYLKDIPGRPLALSLDEHKAAIGIAIRDRGRLDVGNRSSDAV